MALPDPNLVDQGVDEMLSDRDAKMTTVTVMVLPNADLATIYPIYIILSIGAEAYPEQYMKYPDLS